MFKILDRAFNNFTLKVGSGTSWYMFSSIVQGVLTLATTTTFSHMMNRADFGLLAVILAFSYFLSPLCSMGVSHAISRSLFDDFVLDRKHLLSLGLTVVTLMTFLLTLVFTFIFGQGPSREVTLVIITTIALSIRELILTQLRVNENFKYYLITVSSVSLSGLVAPIVCHFIFSVPVLDAYVCTLFASNLLAFLVFSMKERSSKPFNYSSLRYSLYVGLIILPHTLSIITLANMDRIIMSHIVTLQSIGLYFGAFQLANVIFLVTSSLNNAYTTSVMKENISAHLYRFERDYIKILRMVLALTLTVHTLGRFYIELFFPSYFRNITVFTTFAILCISGFFQVIYLMNVNLLSRTATYKKLSFTTPLLVSFATLSMALLTYFFGIIGAAIAYTTGNLLLAFGSQILLKRNSDSAIKFERIRYLLLMFVGLCVGVFPSTYIVSVLSISGFFQLSLFLLGSIIFIFTVKRFWIAKHLIFSIKPPLNRFFDHQRE